MGATVKLALPAVSGSVPPKLVVSKFKLTVEPSDGTTQAISDPFSTASVRNWPNDVPDPGLELP
ncbi:MAG: hypothetical protein QOG67_207, partial [Verrucomicrobiota bacterium]